MSVNSLHIDLPPDESHSVIPWIIVLACSAVLLVLVSQKARAIPEQLEIQAQNVISNSSFPGLRATASGRHLEVSGTVGIGDSVASLLEKLEQIGGVRQISDRIAVVDPVAQQKAKAAQFAQSIANLDASSVSFQPGSISFTPDSESALSKLLDIMQTHPEGRIRIEGHTDNTGADSVNLRVSRDRAAAVANYLMARGIAADRLIVTGYGSTQPIADNTIEAGRTRNRRIEINMVR